MSDTIINTRYSRGIGPWVYGRPAREIIEAEESVDASTYQGTDFAALQKFLSPRLANDLSTSAKRFLIVAVDHYDFASHWQRMWNLATGGSHTSPAMTHSTVPNNTVSAAQMRVERLSNIQAAFGLPIRTFADVLAISRAQIYKWLDARNDIALHEESQSRLRIVESLAKQWLAQSTAPLSSVAREPLDNGSDVITLLSSPVINEVAVKEAFEQLVARLSATKRESQRLLEAGYKRRPSYRSLPSDE